jgi:predicted AlkP superfamily phosphohydrolase/phosphomutase
VEVFSPEEIYQGSTAEQPPALLLRVNDMETELRMDFSYPKTMLYHRPGFFYGSGIHRMDGILIAAGEGVEKGRRSTPFSLLDIAPTVLAGMGETLSPMLCGRSFADRLGVSS